MKTVWKFSGRFFYGFRNTSVKKEDVPGENGFFSFFEYTLFFNH